MITQPVYEELRCGDHLRRFLHLIDEDEGPVRDDAAACVQGDTREEILARLCCGKRFGGSLDFEKIDLGYLLVVLSAELADEIGFSHLSSSIYKQGFARGRSLTFLQLRQCFSVKHTTSYFPNTQHVIAPVISKYNH